MVDPAELDGELRPGTLIGEYVVESKLGQGGMASVYAGTQPVIGKKVAIKVMARRLCLDPTQVERFVQEARAVNQIGHPNIVDVFAFGTLPDGRSYFVMEWLQGETLAARLRRGLLSVPEAVAVMFQICDGLAAAHDKGIVHRDLKPENIFLVPVRNRRMLVKLLDFGIAKLLGQRDERVDRTAAGQTPGTPAYMSPEQARGKDVDHRTDIYSLGVTSFEMICGRLPFVGKEAVDVLYQHIHATPPAPSTLRADLPLQLERLMVQMLAKKAAERPTIPVIEERLADLRDGPLALLGDTGPFPLRALESESGAHRALAGGAPVERTEESVIVPRRGPPTTLIAAAVVLLLIALAVAGVKLGVVPNVFATAGAPAPTAAPATAAPATTTPTPAPAPPTSVVPAAPTTATPGATTAGAATPETNAAPTTEPSAAASAKAPKSSLPPHRRPVRHAAPAHHVDGHGGARDYMIDPFAIPKK